MTRSVTRSPLRTEVGAFTLGFMTFVVSSIALGWLAAWVDVLGVTSVLVLPTLLTVLVVRFFGMPALLVGADGVRIERGLRRRFVSFADLATVRAAKPIRFLEDGVRMPDEHVDGRGVVLELRGGESILLPTIGQSNVQLDALVARIEAGRADFGAHGVRRVLSLRREGRSIEDWSRDLQGLTTHDASFREQPIDADELAFELDDASAPAERRIGAALALRALAPEAPQRIRVVAESCADPALRAALIGVCDETLDEELVESAERSGTAS